MTPDRRHRVVAVVFAIALAVLVTGCTQVVDGRARAAAAPSTVEPGAAPLSGGADSVALAATAALQDFWRGSFPAAFGRAWTDIAAFAPVHTDEADAVVPPCVGRAADLADQAFYCPSADAVVWDADGLVPDLQDRFGTAAVVVVLAHEVGHAVQSRLGVDDAQAADPEGYPTILLEAMADCYAGVALAHLATTPVAGLPMGPAERDEALLALVGFRDPLGVEPGDASAHGNAFDRVSAFQDGFVSAAAASDGATRCAGMSMDNREFTQRRFGSAADEARGGNLALPALLGSVEADARGWFSEVATGRGAGWQPPPISSTRGCPRTGDQGPAWYCAADGTLGVDLGELTALHERFGDYASATLVASRYALATMDAIGADIDGPAAGAAAVCLAGAYTGRLMDPTGSFSLSPGDLDEGVEILLAGDWAVRDAAGEADPDTHGFERVAGFRAGLLGGADSCLPPA